MLFPCSHPACHLQLPGGLPGPWVEREVLWNSYNVHAALTRDDFFNESMLSQGTAYQYVHMCNTLYSFRCK